MKNKILETADTLDYLKVLLASEYVLTVKVQNFHWNMVGPQFFPLHKEWGDMYDALFGYIDTIAELIRAHQEIPPASMREFLVLSIIDERIGSKSHGIEQAVILIEDHSKLDQLCQRTIASANTQNDQVVVDTITGIQSYHQKTLWMLRSYSE